MKSAWLVLGFSMILGCSTAPGVASSSAPLAGDSVKLRGCTFAIDTVVEPGFPPQYAAVVTRSGNAPHCSAASVVLGTSYAQPSLAIASGHDQIVADYSSKSTPSGEAHTALFIVLLSSDLAIEKRTELAAMSPDFNQPELGNVYDGSLDVRRNALLVTGDKDGIIPGETGTGDHYTATYDHFFGSAETAPTSVTAY